MAGFLVRDSLGRRISILNDEETDIPSPDQTPFDPRTSAEPSSPLPAFYYRPPQYDYYDLPQRRPVAMLSPSSESVTTPATSPYRDEKRFRCKYWEELGCTKTFTTSGHASRHSKIHTAEKSIPCSHPGCPKKFTRPDNMKQHLATHSKDRACSPSSRRPRLSPAQRRQYRTLTLPIRTGLGDMMSSASPPPLISPTLTEFGSPSPLSPGN